MWPFQDAKAAGRLGAASAVGEAGAAAPVQVAVMTTIVSPSAVVSPFTGLRGAVLLVELVERIPYGDEPRSAAEAVIDTYVALGAVVIGDLLTLRDRDGDEITIVTRRARIVPASARRGETPLGKIPPEIAPLLRRASGRGVICFRELTLSAGDTLFLKAVVEPTRSVVADGYRSGTRVTYVARDDLAPVTLEEIFATPAW